LPVIEQNQIKRIISKVAEVSWGEEAVAAFRKMHEEMELNRNIGKLVL